MVNQLRRIKHKQRCHNASLLIFRVLLYCLREGDCEGAQWLGWVHQDGCYYTRWSSILTAGRLHRLSAHLRPCFDAPACRHFVHPPRAGNGEGRCNFLDFAYEIEEIRKWRCFNACGSFNGLVPISCIFVLCDIYLTAVEN